MKLDEIISQTTGDNSLVVPTGISRLDEIIGGLHIGHICTIAARPAMGTTSFAVTVLKNVGIKNKVPTAFLSMENSEGGIANRLMAAEFGWRSDFCPEVLSQDDTAKISMLQKIGFETSEQCKENFIQQMKEAPVWIEYNLIMSMDEVINRMEHLKQENNVSVIIIDGLDWITYGTSLEDSESAMTKLAKAAKRLHVAILLTAGLIRDVEDRIANIPMMGDLRKEFYTATYSSIIIFIYRPEYYGIQEDDAGNTKDRAYINIGKNNFGSVGSVSLRFTDHSRFEA
ncbi:MAG: DnaB-like helicase C-terminal domain-containing protein [Bacteroidales bacterium]|nr:DnaB-like helicase C-terminal domain-containing protein [Bacteroidales bacterium]